jgi:hypothetical protein
MQKMSSGMSSIWLGDKSPRQIDGKVNDNQANEKAPTDKFIVLSKFIFSSNIYNKGNNKN